MSQTKHQRRTTSSSSSSSSSSETEDSPPTSPRGFFPPAPGPHPDCPAYCCQMGMDWIRRQIATEQYVNGPTVDRLDTGGAWKPLRVQAGLLAEHLRKWGLIPWQYLDPEVQSRFSNWSPVARQLWESDFVAHREAMVQAWIWHYLDDYIFSFAGNQRDGPLEAHSPVWEHVRTLRRDLDGLRNHDVPFSSAVYRHQFPLWVRLTEHLVRRGLGDEKVFDTEELATHFKQSLLRIAARRDENPDGAHGRDHGKMQDPTDRFDGSIRQILDFAGWTQYYVHGMEGAYTLRFTPVGDDSAKMFDFPFDPEWMEANNAIEVPDMKPDDPIHPRVQLVSQPMLIANGLKSPGKNWEFTLRTPMCVVTPWTFGGEEAKPYIRFGFEKGWEFIPAEVRIENQRKLWKKMREEKHQAEQQAEQQQQQQPLVEGSRDAEPQTTDGHAIDDSGEDAPSKHD